MDYMNDKGEKIRSLDTAISNDKSVTINRLHDVTTVPPRPQQGEITLEAGTNGGSVNSFLFV